MRVGPKPDMRIGPPPPDMSIGPPIDSRVSGPEARASGTCATDSDCPASEYCTYGSDTCAPLSSGTCTSKSVSACSGAMPQCKDGSCFNPGFCSSSSDCHAGETCTSMSGSSNLCFPTSPCGTVVSAMDVANGLYAPGKEVCIHDTVSDVIAESDGDYHVRMGSFVTLSCDNPGYPSPSVCPSSAPSCPYLVTPPGKGLVTELTPEYQAAAISPPARYATIYVQGTVRWDQYHCWWEIHPIKYWR